MQLLLASLAAWSARKQADIIAYFTEENRILKEQLTASRKRIHFTDNRHRRLAANLHCGNDDESDLGLDGTNREEPDSARGCSVSLRCQPFISTPYSAPFLSVLYFKVTGP